jgi:hypothetical protein
MFLFGRKTVFLLLLLFAVQFCMAQKYRKGRFVLGTAFGAATYNGDLAQKYVNVNTVGPMIGIYNRYSISPYFEWRNQLSFAQIQANDIDNRYYQSRNLNFKTDIYELASIMEFNFFSYGINKPNDEFDFTPYVFAGIGGFYFDPKATYNDNEISLRPLRTENVSYSPIQLAIPMGMGFKFAWTNKIEIGFEIGFRRLFTDYLDDVSAQYPNFTQLEIDQGTAAAQSSHAHTYNGSIPAQPGSMRGDNHLTDNYVFSNFTLTYRFFPKDDCP